MANLQKESEFFKDISLKIIDKERSYGDYLVIAKNKALEGDYATEVDVAVEDLIVSEINRLFPGDEIMAEEGHANTVIPAGRIWIIDPICGTQNLARGIKTFCTNIALADNKKLIASCVVDHSLGEFYWSVGKNELYKGDQIYNPRNRHTGTLVDIDLGALPGLSSAQIDKHIKAVSKLARKPGYMLNSLDTSLSELYVAIGKIDGVVNAYNHPWDSCAGSFLIQQSGGIITDQIGNPWEITSVGFICSRNQEIHETLLEAYSES